MGKREDLHADALKSFDEIYEANLDQRERSLQDRRFVTVPGAQWEGALGDQYENRPRFEVDKTGKGVQRIVNQYRNNRISVLFLPKDGTDDDPLAEDCNGLFRADEVDSCAEEAYDVAFEEAVQGGFGAFRLRTELEDEYDEDGNEYQRVRFEPIYEADKCVFFDLGSRRADKSDARSCFVLVPMTPDSYEETYGESPDSWPDEVKFTEFDWCTPEVVYVAEYYIIEDEKETLLIYRGPDGVSEERYTQADLEDEQTQAIINATGMRPAGEKRIKRRKVRKYVMSGGGILEGPIDIAGNCIPIIPVFGKRWFVDNQERFMGQVRPVMDTQRLYNMQLSRLGETSAYSPIETPIFTPEQVAGHQTEWAEQNVNNPAYLLLNPIEQPDGSTQPMGPIGYTKPPAIPETTAALLQITASDLQELTGVQEATEEMQAEMSGKAIELIQDRQDQNNFIYMSNMSRAMKRCGQVWLGMARDIYVETGRRMKKVADSGETSAITLMEPTTDYRTGRTIAGHDMARAKFDVISDVGPSTSTRRAATVRSLVGMMGVAPDDETRIVLGSMAMLNMEGEGLDDVRKYFRKRLLNMGAIEPTQEEQEEMEAAAEAEQPDAAEELLRGEAEKARSQSMLNTARVAETEAKTQKTLAEIDMENKSLEIEALRGPSARTFR
jgi:hypothetical protein